MNAQRGHGTTAGTCSKLKKALGVKRGEVAAKHSKLVKDIQKDLIKRIPSKMHGNLKNNVLTLVKATAENLAGESRETVEEKYKLSQGSVTSALAMFFPSRDAREEALENILLSNGLTSAMIFAEKAPEQLTAYQAALTAGIFSQRYSELRKARQTNHAPEIPVNLVVLLERTISKAHEIHGPIIDV